jgi:hypothetical protein
MAISRNQAFEELLRIHPHFSPAWDEHLRSWGGDEPGITNDFAVYADYVIGLIETKEGPELEASLNAIERFIESGDDDVRYGATVGFLEDVTNVLLSRDPEYSTRFCSLLGTKSKAFCVELDRFWGTATPGIAKDA